MIFTLLITAFLWLTIAGKYKEAIVFASLFPILVNVFTKIATETSVNIHVPNRSNEQKEIAVITGSTSG